MKKYIYLSPEMERITIYDALEKVSEAARFGDFLDVYVEVTKDQHGQDVHPTGGQISAEVRLGADEFKGKKLDNFISFCAMTGIIPRNPNSPWIADYDGRNAWHNISHDITINEFQLFAKSFDIEVVRGTPLISVVSIPTNEKPQIDDIGLSKRERQIRAIEHCIKKLSYDPLCIPEGGKAKLGIECKRERKDLFGAGTDPFKEAWQKAVDQKRVRTKNHSRHSSK